MRTLLVDGDLIAYSCTSSAEVEVNWEADLWTLHTDLAQAKENFTSRIKDAMELTGCDQLAMCLTSPDNFRYGVLPSYKGNRKATRKPMGYKPFIEWINENYQTYLKPTLEADDVLGILATHPTLIKGEKILWSADKDLQSIPCTLWRGKVGPDGKPVVVEVSEEEADRYHLLQTLTGDPTDGYKGCPGMGAVKANKLLDTAKEPWRAIVDCFVKAGLTEADALVQARVARICRAQDYNFRNKEVILWNPPS